ncbi:MAG: hypothetical protein ACRDRL_03810 [Sciscionella sp.]
MPGATVTTIAPADVKGACPLLPKESVANAYGVGQVNSQEEGALPGATGVSSFICQYTANDTVLLKLVFVTTQLSGAAPEQFIRGALENCQQVHQISGLGDDAASCRHSTDPASTIVSASVSTKRGLVAVEVAGATVQRQEATLEGFARQVLAHF